MKNQKQNNSIKKIKPYPIPINILDIKSIIKGEILKMESHGVIVNCDKVVLELGRKITIQFQLPVLNEVIKSEARVIKKYEQITDKSGHLRFLYEVHFINLDAAMEILVNDFISRTT